ncbi:MAG: SirB2 family protein [Rhodocyclaceae bacterium]|nr:SirB2 family protein [Rhodocyclaceae bacterium]MBX3668005.1 SirB2 family protein [Rhodocyclaceae bacterium]
MSYALLKAVHVTCVALSGTGFFLRGLLMLSGSPWLAARPVKILPHVVDSVLLASAAGLALTLHQYPFVHAWLTAKVLGLLAYILLGMLALRPSARSIRLRGAAWLSALLVFAYIVSVALSRDVRGAMIWL